MSLRAIADELRGLPRGAAMEEELRACLANLVIGIERRHILVGPVRRRLTEMVAAVGRAPVRDFRVLLREHDSAMSAFGLDDHFHRPGPLDDFLNHRAVTIQANEDGMLGRFWLSPPRRAGGAEIKDAFKSGACVGHVGRDDRPIWLTPFAGEVAEVIDKADDPFCTPGERAAHARRIIALLGLSHIQQTSEILAMVTRATIGELLYERPDDRKLLGPAGSTAIEARGHRRFRAWPRDTADNPFGRTFDTDDAARRAAGPLHGAPEAVRPRLAMTEFKRCVYLGPLTASSKDAKGAYLEDLGVQSRTAPDLLDALADMTGL